MMTVEVVEEAVNNSWGRFRILVARKYGRVVFLRTNLHGATLPIQTNKTAKLYDVLKTCSYFLPKSPILPATTSKGRE